MFCFRLVCRHLLFSYKAINILNGYVKKDDTDKSEQKQPEPKKEGEPKLHQGEAKSNQTGGQSNPEASKKEGNPKNWDSFSFLLLSSRSFQMSINLHCYFEKY